MLKVSHRMLLKNDENPVVICVVHPCTNVMLLPLALSSVMAALKVFHFRGFHIQKWNIIIPESGTCSTFGL